MCSSRCCVEFGLDCHGRLYPLHWNIIKKASTIKSLKKSDDKEDNGQGSIELTGNLGDVMKESVRIAYTVAKMYAANIRPNDNFFSEAQVHVHVPEVC